MRLFFEIKEAKKDDFVAIVVVAAAASSASAVAVLVVVWLFGCISLNLFANCKRLLHRSFKLLVVSF